MPCTVVFLFFFLQKILVTNVLALNSHIGAMSVLLAAASCCKANLNGSRPHPGVRTVIAFFALIFVVGSVSCTPPTGPDGFDGAQVWRVSFKDAAGQKAFDNVKKQLSAQVFRHTKSNVDFLVGASNLNKAKELLASSKLDYKVLTDDFGKSMKAADPKMTTLEEGKYQSKQRKYKLTFKHYHGVKDIHAYMDYLAENYEAFVKVESIGQTYEKREMKLLTITNDQNAPYFWIDAAFHAREWLAPTTALYIMRELVERKANLSAALKKLNYYIIPLINLDGYEYTRTENRIWRRNRRPGPKGIKEKCFGVDLNRNFDMQWAFGGDEGSSSDPCMEDYRGTKPDSEAETQAIIKFLSSKITKLKAMVSFHTYSQLILYSYGYKTKEFPPNEKELHRVGMVAKQSIMKLTGKNYTVQGSADLYPAAGISIDWATKKGVPFVYCMELRDDGKLGFILPASEIIPTGKEGFELIKAVADAIGKPQSRL
ncbi:carboxypeptidase B-like [Bemisia tabaci]|uniref:carboxypeptidase B-like n=1 Tax=Bemisia tabaci TaxID=7038 RepID=UPI003B282156